MFVVSSAIFTSPRKAMASGNPFLFLLSIQSWYLPADISGGVYLLEVEKGGQTHRLPLTVIK